MLGVVIWSTTLSAILSPKIIRSFGSEVLLGTWHVFPPKKTHIPIKIALVQACLEGGLPERVPNLSLKKWVSGQSLSSPRCCGQAWAGKSRWMINCETLSIWISININRFYHQEMKDGTWWHQLKEVVYQLLIYCIIPNYSMWHR